MYVYDVTYFIFLFHDYLVIELGCGKTSSDNCTYLVQESSLTPTSPCYYKICSANTAICRIRYANEKCYY